MIGLRPLWLKITFFTLLFGGVMSCQEVKTKQSQVIKPHKTQSSEKNQDSEINQDDTTTFHTNQGEPKVERFFYPQMSFCGGSLEGLYSNDALIRIESTYGYDMGYSEKNIDFKKGRITKIEYREHYADWETYNQRYGDEEGDIDASKMTYVDTLYILKFEPIRQFTIYSGKKRVQQQVSKELLDRLLDCTATMQKELTTERVKR
jgi:hypothetical protein